MFSFTTLFCFLFFTQIHINYTVNNHDHNNNEKGILQLGLLQANKQGVLCLDLLGADCSVQHTIVRNEEPNTKKEIIDNQAKNDINNKASSNNETSKNNKFQTQIVDDNNSNLSQNNKGLGGSSAFNSQKNSKNKDVPSNDSTRKESMSSLTGQLGSFSSIENPNHPYQN